MPDPFWIMEYSTDLAVIGRTYPQHQEMSKGYDYDAPDSIHKIPWDRFADFEPNFRTVVLAGVAKPTDVVNGVLSFSGLLVSDRVRALLEFARLPPHRTYPVPVEHRRKSLPGYSWLHLPHGGFEVPAGTPPDGIQAAIRADSSVAELDLFLGMGQTCPASSGPPLGPVWFASDRLRTAFTALGLTGADFREAVLPDPSHPFV